MLYGVAKSPSHSHAILTHKGSPIYKKNGFGQVALRGPDLGYEGPSFIYQPGEEEDIGKIAGSVDLAGLHDEDWAQVMDPVPTLADFNDTSIGGDQYVGLSSYGWQGVAERVMAVRDGPSGTLGLAATQAARSIARSRGVRLKSTQKLHPYNIGVRNPGMGGYYAGGRNTGMGGYYAGGRNTGMGDMYIDDNRGLSQGAMLQPIDVVATPVAGPDGTPVTDTTPVDGGPSAVPVPAPTILDAISNVFSQVFSAGASEAIKLGTQAVTPGSSAPSTPAPAGSRPVTTPGTILGIPQSTAYLLGGGALIYFLFFK